MSDIKDNKDIGLSMWADFVNPKKGIVRTGNHGLIFLSVLYAIRMVFFTFFSTSLQKFIQSHLIQTLSDTMESIYNPYIVEPEMKKWPEGNKRLILKHLLNVARSDIMKKWTKKNLITELPKDIHHPGKTPDIYIRNSHFLVALAYQTENLCQGLSDDQKETLLLIGVFFNNPTLIEKALNAGAKTETLDFISPIHLAALLGNKESIQYLYQKSPELIESKNDFDESPLMLAAANGAIETVELLIQLGAHINQQDTNGNNAFVYASSFGHEEVVKLLLDQGPFISSALKAINLKQIKDEKIIKLIKERESQSIEFIKIIKQENIDQIKTLKPTFYLDYFYEGYTPLSAAASKGNLEICKLLVERGASVNLPKNQGQSALERAIRSKSTAVVQYLIEQGASISQSELNTLLCEAIDKNEIQATEFFLSKVIDLNQVKSNGTTPLIYAVKKERREIAALLIEKGANINYITMDGSSALRHAILNNQIETARFLIEKGADVNQSDSNGNRPLLFAADKGHKEIVKLLIEHGADVNQVDSNGNRPLLFAAQNGFKEIVELLIEHGADVNLGNSKGSTPLALAANSDHKEIAALLIEHGADVNKANSLGSTPLSLAAQKGFKGIVEFLMKAKANIYDLNLSLYSQNIRSIITEQLHLNQRFINEIANHRYNVVEDLIEHVDLNRARDDKERTALQIAIEDGNFEFSKLFIEHGADVNQTDSDGNTPLTFAAEKGFKEIAALLIKHGADVNLGNSNGSTPLTFAAEKGFKEIAALLIEHGAEVNKVTSFGSTSLTLAAEKDFKEIVKLLIEHGADINQITKKETTALIFAVNKGNQEIAEYLIEHGADVNLGNSNGSTPLTFAAEKGFTEIIKFLIEHGADVNLGNSDGSTPLTFATEKGFKEIIKLLIEHGADINQTTKKGNTALIFAADKGNQEIVEFLIEHGADVNKANSFGSTPLTFAAEKGFKKIVQLLVKAKANIYDLKLDKYSQEIQDVIKNQLDLNQSFIDKIANQRYNEAKDLITQVDLNRARDNKQRTALEIAIQDGNFEFSKLLIENGADVNQTNSNGNRPLLLAAQNGFKEIAELLIEHGVDVNKANSFGSTSLILAVKNNHKQIAALLIKHGADVNLGNSIGSTPLTFAAEKGFKKIAELLIEHGADVNLGNSNGSMPLTWAAEKGFKKIAELLIEKGANIEHVSSQGLTALMYASSNNQREIVELLVKAKANIYDLKLDKYSQEIQDVIKNQLNLNQSFIDKIANQRYNEAKDLITQVDLNRARDNKQRTALEIAIQDGNFEFSKLLIENGADVNQTDSNGNTLLTLAAEKGHKEIAKLLIEHGADVNQVNSNRSTALTNAVVFNCIEIVKLLIERGATVNYANSHGSTPLTLAAIWGHTEIVKFLLENGANIEHVTSQGSTALMYAASKDHQETVELLVKAKANIFGLQWSQYQKNVRNIIKSQLDLNKRFIKEVASHHYNEAKDLIEQVDLNRALDDKKRTALEIAIQNGNIEFSKILIENGAAVTLKNAKKETSLDWAIPKGSLEFVQYLIEKGAEIKDHYLIIAIQSGHHEIAQYLIEKKIDLSYQDSSGNTALHHAIEKQDLELARLLVEKGASIFIRNKNEISPLIKAIEKKERALIPFMLSKQPLYFNSINTLYLQDDQQAFLLSLIDEDISAFAYVAAEDRKKQIEMIPSPRNRLYLFYLYGMEENLKKETLDASWLDLINLIDIESLTRKSSFSRLTLAIQLGKKDLAKKFIAEGVDIHFSDRNQITPLMQAIKSEEKELVELMLEKHPLKSGDLKDWNLKQRTLLLQTLNRNELIPYMEKKENHSKLNLGQRITLQIIQSESINLKGIAESDFLDALDDLKYIDTFALISKAYQMNLEHLKNYKEEKIPEAKPIDLNLLIKWYKGNNKNAVQTFVKRIIEQWEAFLAVPKDPIERKAWYARLNNIMRHVTHALSEDETNREFVLQIIEETDGYCGERYLSAAYTMYGMLFSGGDSEAESMEVELANLLARMRRSIAVNLSQSNEINVVKTVHTENRVLSILAEKRAVPTYGRVSHTDLFTATQINEELILGLFDSLYTEESIIKELDDAIHSKNQKDSNSNFSGTLSNWSNIEGNLPEDKTLYDYMNMDFESNKVTFAPSIIARVLKSQNVLTYRF